MIRHASGTFDVKMTPRVADGGAADTDFGRMSIDKQFHGDLEATGRGEMLASGNATGSGAYVAIERVTGTLGGRGGSFVFQHSGTMTRGTPTLRVAVVPDSGTDQLAGLAGSLTIHVDASGKHSYDFEYSLPDAP